MQGVVSSVDETTESSVEHEGGHTMSWSSSVIVELDLSNMNRTLGCAANVPGRTIQGREMTGACSGGGGDGTLKEGKGK